ncbi:hypothetical protein LTR95_004458 [Oleoguttula sp. CCFEE 5521]
MGASESKLAFKEDIFRLSGTPDISPTDPWWSRFYTLPESDSDVFALWSPTDLRALTAFDAHCSPDSPAPQKNAESLIYAVVRRLRDGVEGGKVEGEEDGRELLNCVRVLTRLLPYLWEVEGLRAWEDSFFWQQGRASWVWDGKYNRRGPPFDGLNPGKALPHASEESSLGRPLGEELLDLLVNALFLLGFTLPRRGDENGRADNAVTYSIWQSGIGCKQSVGMSKENERNAMEVLRLLLAICSRAMYIMPNVAAQADVKALTYLTTQSSRQVVLSLLCSLLNTVLKYNPASWRVPLDLSAITKDPKQLLVTYSLQLLTILIIYPVPGDEPNAFRKALGRLHRVEDFQFIQQGLTVVLSQPILGVASYVPTASKAVPWAPEMLVLSWELLQCNKRFRSFIIDTDRAHDFFVLVLYYAMDAKDDIARQGIIRMAILILQTLTVESTFGIRLNKSFSGQESLPAVLRIPNFHGTYADYLITSVHTLMTTTKGRLETVYPALLAIIGNIAPYVRDLQRATSSKLLDLFLSLASPTFLLSGGENHKMLSSLLESLNAILEHQYESNRRFVEIIARSHQRFEALRDFTVNGALAEVDRMAQERKGRNSGIMSPLRRVSTDRPSVDGARSPNGNSRQTSLGNVPEHSAFTIGEDEDDDDDDMTRPTAPQSHVRGSRASSVDDAVPVQSRSMSEKARGKLPVGQGSFSRETSRNASTTSLASMTPATPTTLSSGMPSTFTPTPGWLETWLPHLPLHTILTVIAAEHDRDPTLRRRPFSSTTSIPTLPAASLSSPLTDLPAPPKVQHFHWSPLALGWYLSMLWGFIYAADGLNNPGSNGLWAGTHVKLFLVERRADGGVSLRRPKGAVDAVGGEIARRVAGLGFGGGGSTASSPVVGSVREV